MSSHSTPRKPRLDTIFSHSPSPSTATTTPSQPSSSSTLLTLPPFSSTSRPRLQALYADISRQKTSNPESYHANVEWWRRALEVVVSTGYLISQSHSLATGGSKLVLTADSSLLNALKVEGVGKPLALGAVIPELVTNTTLLPFKSFLTSPYSIYPTALSSWMGVPSKAAWYLVGKPMSWALERAGVTGEDGIVTSLTHSLTGSSGSSHGNGYGGYGGSGRPWYGDYVVKVLVERAADEVMRIQRGKEGEGAAGRLYSTEAFRRVFASAVGVNGVVEGLGVDADVVQEDAEVLLDERDMQVLSKYLERDRGCLVVDGDILKFVLSSAPAEERTITVVDRGILELKNAVENMHKQIESLQSRIANLTAKASSAIRDKQKAVATGYLKSRKQLQDVLERRLGSLQTLEATLYSVEEAAQDIQIMKSYESSTATLRAILSHPSLKKEKVEETMEAMAEAMGDAREIDDAVRIGGDVALGIGEGQTSVDDSELEEELNRMVEEMKLEERIRERENEPSHSEPARTTQPSVEEGMREKVAVLA
ncbi:hypothetical protein ONZ45_g15624 [Pleurotus djamor]|nr:hypothetical protein ONZ45_g15624 [Pleurotus djamor]